MNFKNSWNTPFQSKNQSWIDRSFLYEKNQEESQKQKLLEEDYLKKYFKTNNSIEGNIFFEEIIKLIKTKRLKIDTNKNLKWIDLVEITFLSQNYASMIDLFIESFWFIPEELYTKLIFVTKNSFEKASQIFNYIYNKEKSSKEQNTINSLRKARNLLLKYLFLDKKWKWDKIVKWLCEQLKNKWVINITPDTNWIFLKLSSSPEHIINSHIPYQELDDELIIYLFENSFIDENTFLEIKSRKFSLLKKENELEKTKEIQLDLVLKALNIKNTKTIDEKINIITEKIINSPKDIALVVYNNSIIIPDIVYLWIIKALPEKEAFFTLTNFSEQFACLVSKEKFEQDNKNYLMWLKIKWSYKIRRKSANWDTRLYNAYKALNIAFWLKLQNDSWFYVAKTSIDEVWLTLIHTFLWSKVNKVVLNPKKHLQREPFINLSSLKEIDKKTLENMEIFFRCMNIASKSKESLENNVSNDILDIKSNITLIQDILILALNYYPNHYDKLSTHLKNIIMNEDKESYNKFLLYSRLMFEKLKNWFEEFFEKWQNLDFLKNSIEKKTITFDEKFLEYIKNKKLPNYCYSEDLCNSWKTSTIVEIKSSSWDVWSIDYLSEMSAINALNLDSNKPLIVVSWWCREVSSDWINSLDIFSSVVLNYAIEKWANLSIPWTQSWIWNSFAKKLIEYEKSWKYIWTSNNINVFAVSPKNNMADNDIVDEEKFAPLPLINHLYIPTSAWWNLTWVEVIDVWYFQLIESAEQVYNRLDRHKSRINIIWNWGLFSIAEAYASIKNWSKITFIEWTWRFADLMSAVLNSKDKNWWLFLNIQSLQKSDNIVSILDSLNDLLKSYLSEECYSELIKKDLWNMSELKEVFSLGKNIDLSDTKTAYYEICKNIQKWSSVTPKNILYILNLIEFLKLSFLLENKPNSCKLEDLDIFLENKVAV